jgi:hypothetical protein
MEVAPDELVPIDEVSSPVVKVALDLPGWVNQKEIGVDLARLENLCAWAGIKTLTLSVNDDEAPSHGRPITIGIDKNGQLLGGFEESAVKTHSISVGPLDDDTSLKCESFIDVNITLNSKALTDFVREHGKKGARSPEAWAKILDQELRTALKEAGLKHLMTRGKIESISALVAASGPIIGAIESAGLGATTSFILSIAGLLVVEQIALNAVRYIRLKNIYEAFLKLEEAAKYSYETPNKPRPSIIGAAGIELDRAIVFSIMVETKALIKQITP